MAAKELPAASAVDVEEGKTRDLYNALRTSEHGVSIEALGQALYFLQHAEFTLFDVKDAFRSSTGASESFLAYKEFQIALTKIARVKYYGNYENMAEPGSSIRGGSSKQRRRLSEVDLVGSLVSQLLENHPHLQLDPLRRQLVRRSTLDTLEHYLPQLVQSFQLYGKQNRLTANTAPSMQSTMTLDGFVDFLNAYFEYEEFFSYDDLTRMSKEVLSAFTSANTKAESKSNEGQSATLEEEFNFTQYLELVCRVASAFHHKLLMREGAQLRRAVESCRLEFSLEMLMDHMRITIIPKNDSLKETASDRNTSTKLSGGKQFDGDISYSPRGDETAAIYSIIQDIRGVLRLDAADSATKKPVKYRLKREGSLAGQLSRKPSSNPADAHSTAMSQLKTKANLKLPQVAMIREVVMPPSLPEDAVQYLENALKFQNMGQFNMALSALDSCKLCYQEHCVRLDDVDDDPDSHDTTHTEVELFFALQISSIYDSAHRDALALKKYYEAMKLAQQLPVSHPGRILVNSCMGVTLFYAGELGLAQKCHQLVLDARKATTDKKVDASLHFGKRADTQPDGSSGFLLVDTATAMNNLACCLSQDQTESSAKSMDSAYLLFKHAREIYTDAFGPAHARVGVITRNLDRVRACQSGVVIDAVGALARGEYAHVIPGSTFQIQALEVATKPLKAKSSKKSAGKKKKAGK